MRHAPAAAAVDAGNQPNAASTSTDNTVQFTAGPPTVTINQASGQTDPSSAASITFTVQFSEPVTGFAASDIEPGDHVHTHNLAYRPVEAQVAYGSRRAPTDYVPAERRATEPNSSSRAPCRGSAGRCSSPIAWPC